MRQATAGLVYPATVHERPGGVLVTFPDFEEARTTGRDVGEALRGAPDCLREALATRIRRGEGIPDPSDLTTGTHTVAVPAEIAAKGAVCEAFKVRGLSKSQLAARLDVDESEVRRILDPNHRTKLGQLADAAGALGVRLQVTATPI